MIDSAMIKRLAVQCRITEQSLNNYNLIDCIQLEQFARACYAAGREDVYSMIESLGGDYSLKRLKEMME